MSALSILLQTQLYSHPNTVLQYYIIFTDRTVLQGECYSKNGEWKGNIGPFNEAKTISVIAFHDNSKYCGHIETPYTGIYFLIRVLCPESCHIIPTCLDPQSLSKPKSGFKLKSVDKKGTI